MYGNPKTPKNFGLQQGGGTCPILPGLLVIRWSYLGGGRLFAKFKSLSGNLANIKKDFPWLKPILKSCCIMNSFLVIFGNLRGQLYLKVAVDELFSCVLRTMWLISFGTLQHQRYLELSYLSYLSSKKCCLLLFLENVKILENVWKNRCSRVLLGDTRKKTFK